MTRSRSKRIRPTVGDVTAALESIAPLHAAADWDNVGLLVGDGTAPCANAFLTIDLTPSTLRESRRLRSDLIVAYHPPIFRPIQSLRAQSDGPESLVYAAAAAGQAVYAMHTALDAAAGGTNDALADVCGLRDSMPFEEAATPRRECKVVVFVPPGDASRVSRAMFAAGAGRIGAYSECSFSAPGVGTFLGSSESNPTIGRRGRRESVDELRLEVVCPNERLTALIEAIRTAHSYEEPAFDVYPLTSPPLAGVGMGRVGTLASKTTLGRLARRLKRSLALTGVEVIGDANVNVATAAVCAGSAGRLAFDAPRARRVHVLITGELRHHDRLLYARHDINVILLGHCNSERPVLPVVKRRLEALVPSIRVAIAANDRPPASFM